jgi:dihydroorotate dehydrogenase
MWRFVRSVLFRLEPERAHHLALFVLRLAFAVPGLRALCRRRCRVEDPRLAVRLWDLTFPSPLGLAAGFDKDARWFNDLAALGFGFVEVGTLTGVAQPGNPKPRLFRLPRDGALLNRFGFNNRGSADAAARLARSRINPVLGVNLGKSKVVPNEEAASDYLASFERLFPYAKYVVVNVSSPNTPGLRALQDKEALRSILRALQRSNASLAERRGTTPRPLLVKVAPDLTPGQVDDVVDLALELGLEGLVATNTTIARDGLQTPEAEVAALGPGGLSGRPLTTKSRAFVRELYRKSKGRIPIIGVGGIMDGDDAWEMIRAGASLLQTYTGFIYGGPFFAHKVQRRLLERLEGSGHATLADAVGEAAD